MNRTSTCLLFVFFFCTSFLIAQTKLDSLLSLVKSETSKKAQFAALENQASSHIFKNPGIALDLMDEYIRYAKEIDDDERIAFAMASKMVPYLFIEEKDSALMQKDLALSLLKENPSENQAKTYRKIGLYYHFSGNYDDALSYYLESVQIAENSTTGNQTISSIYNNLTSIYQTIGDMSGAQKYARKALSITDKSDYVLMASNYLNLSTTFQLELDNYDSLKYYSYKAFEYSRKGNDDLTIYRTACNLLISALDHDDSSAFNLSTRIIDSLDFDFTQSLHQGGYYYAKSLKIFNEGNYNQAILLAQQVLDLGDALNDGFRYRALAANIQRRSFLKLKQYENATEVGNLLFDFKDSLYNSNTADKIFELKASFETQKKELLIEQQQKELALLSQEKKLQRILAILAITGLLLVAIILLLVYNRQKLRAKNLQISEKLTQEKLKSSELEKLQLQESLEVHQQEITAITLSMIRKNEQIEQLNEQVDLLDKNEEKAHELKRKIKENQIADDEWNKFNLHFSKVHPGFYDKIIEVCSNCSPNEIRLACLMKMNLTSREIANIAGVNIRSVDQNKYRMKKKMNLPEETKLVDFVRNL